jgi:hypothetical protein
MMNFIVRERLKWGGEEELLGDEGKKGEEEGFEGFGDECKFFNFLFFSSFSFCGCEGFFFFLACFFLRIDFPFTGCGPSRFFFVLLAMISDVGDDKEVLKGKEEVSSMMSEKGRTHDVLSFEAFSIWRSPISHWEKSCYQFRSWS